jgi:hypothetical protein
MGPSAAERRTRRPPRRRHDLAKSIRETLLALGGQAHRAVVINQLAREFGFDERHIPDDFRTSVVRCFEDVVRDEAKRSAFGFHLPFGEGSYRWGVQVSQIDRSGGGQATSLVA